MANIEESDCLKVLESHLGPGRGFHFEGFDYELFEEILGFHGTHAVLRLRFKTKEDGVSREEKFFVKSVTSSPIIFNRYLGVIRAFEKEDEMLNKVLPGLGEDLGPRCHLSIRNEYMVLEDLTKEGYRPCKTMDLPHAECAVRELARLHGASLVVPEEELKAKYPGVMFESLFFKTPGGMPGMLEAHGVIVSRICEEFFEDLDQGLVRNFVEFVSDTIAEFMKPSKEYRNVILHGDPWGNNFLYRYDKTKKLPLQARLVDFQASRFAPPALDLVEFLYLSTSPEFRKLHTDHLLSHYYLTLSQILSSRGIPVSSLLPRDSFLDSCRHYDRLGITVNVYYSYLSRLPAAHLAPFARSPVSFLGIIIGGDASCGLKSFKKNYAYRKQFTESLMVALRLYKELHPQIEINP